METQIQRDYRLHNKLITACGWIAAAFGLVALAGWVLQAVQLASAYPNYIPMAPNTALFFIITGILLAYRWEFLINGITRVIRMITLILIEIFSLIFLSLSLEGIHLGIEQLGIPINTLFNGMPLGHMSPVTAFCFVIIAFALIFFNSEDISKNLWSILAFSANSIVVLISFALMMAYILGTPLFYGGQTIPPALTTSLAFLFLSIGILFAYAIQIWPSVILKRALEASERRFMNTLDNMMEGCQIIDRNWRYVYINNSAAEQGQRRKDELLGKTMMECYPGIENTVMFGVLRLCMEKREPKHLENEFIYPDGSKGWFDLSVQPVEEGIFVLSLDITKQKLAQLKITENEDLLKRAQAVAHLGSWSLDIQTKELNWSQETYRIFGIPETTPINYDFFLSLIHPDDVYKVDKASQESLNGSAYDIEHRILVNDSVKWVREQAEILFDKKGTAIKKIGTVQDITIRKQADEKIHLLNAELELRINQRTKQLQESNSELEAFAYSISHDLRAPLRSIIGYSNILLEDFEGKINEEGLRVINTIIKNTQRMGQLIDDLLEFSRTGRKNLAMDTVNVKEMVHEIMSDMTDNEKDRNFEITIRDLFPCKADRNMLRQVWINLISNALKYSRKSNPSKIEIDSRIENNMISYFIRDNGCGFDMKYSDKLYGVFQRLHTLEEFEGTGVGLALVKRIITRHNGKVWAEAKLNEGATFYFSLPV